MHFKPGSAFHVLIMLVLILRCYNPTKQEHFAPGIWVNCLIVGGHKLDTLFLFQSQDIMEYYDTLAPVYDTTALISVTITSSGGQIDTMKRHSSSDTVFYNKWYGDMIFYPESTYYLKIIITPNLSGKVETLTALTTVPKQVYIDSATYPVFKQEVLDKFLENPQEVYQTMLGTPVESLVQEKAFFHKGQPDDMTDTVWFLPVPEFSSGPAYNYYVSSWPDPYNT
ncbi:MAG: hypothetical protein ABIA63_01970, partial [bacterium]